MFCLPRIYRTKNTWDCQHDICLVTTASAMLFQAPRWVYVLCALGMFFYQTMDSLDGKQCRRTGRSSGIEELFDHGCDSLACCKFSI